MSIIIGKCPKCDHSECSIEYYKEYCATPAVVDCVCLNCKHLWAVADEYNPCKHPECKGMNIVSEKAKEQFPGAVDTVHCPLGDGAPTDCRNCVYYNGDYRG